jgi:metal-responsive CopG/Arc/MetJ family transcriptional regulator
MKTQNITLSLPQNTLQKLELLAARRNSSISQLLTEAIEKMLAEEASYEEARRRQIALMKKGIDLEFQKPVSRDAVHQR